MKKVILLLLLLLFSAATGRGLYYLKDGFSARRIQSLSSRVSEDWGKEVDQILGQTFHYVDRGRQCFAFVSNDDRYILKFPRTDIYKTPFWVRVLPVKQYREHLEKDHLERQTFILNSFSLSLRELKGQTGLIATHLGQSSSKRKLILIDKLGCKHAISLGKTPFVLQYKKPILMKAFSLAIQKGNREEAKRILDAWIDLVVERGQKGILNRDRSFLRNYGFDGQKAYQIDIGSFFQNPELTPAAAYQKSVRDSADAVQEWLAQTDPEMLEYFQKKFKTVL